MQKDSGNSENEKEDLCGQSPLVDTKNIVKVKKTADFLKNQPFVGPSGEIRYILIPDGNENHGVAAVEPSASDCPPDSHI